MLRYLWLQSRNTPQLWRFMVFKCGIIFFDCATSIFSCSIFSDRKGQVYSRQQGCFIFIQRSNEGQAFGVSLWSIKVLQSILCVYDLRCRTKLFLQGSLREGRYRRFISQDTIRPSRLGPCQPTLRFHCRYPCMYVDGIRTIELHNSFTFSQVVSLYGLDIYYAVMSSTPDIIRCAALLICPIEGTTTPRTPHTYCSMGRYTFLFGYPRRHWWLWDSFSYC